MAAPNSVAIRNPQSAIRNGVIRRPAVAGYYYPADPTALRAAVDALTPPDRRPLRAVAALLPHGSYRQAGAVMGATVAQLAIPRRCVILGPSHTGSRRGWSLMESGAYRTPLGDLPIDETGAEALCTRCPFLVVDAWAHRGEHAIEVVLPFLQRYGPPDLTIVPIITGSDDDGERAQLATALAQVVRLQEEDVLLIASSDLSHYEPQARGALRDRVLLEAIRTLDSPGLIRQVCEDDVLMCGATAVACVLEAAKALGATQARLVGYGTSVEAGGDPDSVIGYAGVIVS